MRDKDENLPAISTITTDELVYAQRFNPHVPIVAVACKGLCKSGSLVIDIGGKKLPIEEVRRVVITLEPGHLPTVEVTW